MKISSINKVAHGEDEWKALVYFCKLGLTSKQEFIHNIDFRSLNWDLFMKQAWFHRVRPLVHQGLAEWNEKHLIPQHILEELESVHQLKSLKIWIGLSS
ncbi:MAG: hypothetical protein ACI9Z3_000893 [Roseivirga sp.]|jgi:hypothetical protein